MKRVQADQAEYRPSLTFAVSGISGQAASGAIYAPRCFTIFNESLVMGLLMSGPVWTSSLTKREDSRNDLLETVLPA